MAGKILQIVTNNPDIYWSPEMPYGVVFTEGSPLDVLDKTEELLQHGWRLLSAPLPPNVPIMRGPYRSLVIEESESKYDKDGIIAIEKARDRYLIERQKNCAEPQEDFALIDRQMLQRALRDISILNSISS
ncbi:MAG: GrdX family protein [Synergistaceae bacterium]|jgi:hypothetical protein|nr:GrdX family protein [Synergistaceae bacterium]PKL04367.1 MAG: hypothetical protein CVV54_05680 [Synergistetes bacterium HGW-Synergistetes-1]MBP9559466.1 GrdX family protein [Synergistaceae bacterium]MBP9976012.1 GrdX family protein [Synergistaceae bacterium]MCE5183681.1 GrdX family protein [Synergistaceae bacterium]